MSVRKLAAVLIAMSILGSANRVEADGFTYSDFSSTDGLNLVGKTTLPTTPPPTVFGTALRLNPASMWQVGAAWYSTKQPVAGGFETTFDFRIEVPTATGNTGADGFAFLIQNMGVDAIGGNLGNHFDGITNSIAVEFDTFDNSNSGDPNGNHISVHTNPAAGGPNSHEEGVYSIGWNSSIPNLSEALPSEASHTVRILYVPGTMTIWMDDLVTPKIAVAVDLDDQLDLATGTAFVGFTGGTGAQYETHDILNWTFSPIPEPSTYAALISMGLMGLAIAWRRRKRAV
ncbi:MAG: PEP-CTERM sorting domain-containing protein [Planctomycetes bacterium]|nr:PEP-CTERM sorting domain-containing protein [Planctomycetota bacterium]